MLNIWSPNDYVVYSLSSSVNSWRNRRLLLFDSLFIGSLYSWFELESSFITSKNNYNVRIVVGRSIWIYDLKIEDHMNFYFILLISSVLFLNTFYKIMIIMITKRKKIRLKTTSPKLIKKSSVFSNWLNIFSLSHYLTTGDWSSLKNETYFII